MRDTKTELKLFSVLQWKKEEDYLRAQHKNGWEFVKVNYPGFYHFKKCEPEDVIYQLDYNPESTTQKDEYTQMFYDCGWEYLQNFVGYSYFRKPASEMDGKEEEIFCDDASRLDMVKQVIKQRISPLVVIFFLCIIPQIFVQAQISQILFVIFCILFVLYLALFAMLGIQYLKYLKTIHK